MQYRTDPKTGNQLSVLGFGCMRLPASQEKSEQLLVQAVSAGINYFDTAYIYPDSERRLGAALEKHGLRDRVYLATKLPVLFLRKPEDIERIFQAQLERLKTDHIDYYLMHMLPDMARWDQLRSWDIEAWLQEKRASGAIGQIGFSFHGDQRSFLDLLDAYDWDFCQIQYNYADENNQAGVTGLRCAAEKGLPVVIMEPLLGGKLATGLPKSAQAAFRRADPDCTPAGWAFRWLYNQSEVTVVLSGMNDESQLTENVRIASDTAPNSLTPDQLAIFGEVRKAFESAQTVPCTGCNYCMPCPRGINIPACFSALNASRAISFTTGLQQYMLGTGGFAAKNPGTASRCVQCGQCERRCPQSIEIRKHLKAVERRLEPFWFKWFLAAGRKFASARR